MASTRQLKHHARFHAAVLRYLVPPSPPHPTHQEAVDQSCKEVCFQAQSIKSAELFAAEKCCDNDDDRVESGKALLSRARRKRLKLKKLKEQSDAMPAKKFVGPSLPDVLERKRHDDLDCKSGPALLQDHGTSEKCPYLVSTQDREDVHDVREDEFLSTATEEEKRVHTAGELESVCTKTWEEKDEHDGVEPEPLSKAKRRRLAKKKFQDNLRSRHALADSSFMAEVMGGDIVIKKMV